MKNYGVLKGHVRKVARDADSSPHSALLVDANGVQHRVAIKVRSSRGPEYRRLVEYVIVDDVRHPVVIEVRELSMGWHDLRDRRDDEAAIDYIRSNTFRAFPEWLATEDDRLTRLPEGQVTGLDSIVRVEGQTVRMTHEIENLVFKEK